MSYNTTHVRAQEVLRLAGPLGSRQSGCLRAMCEHGAWPGAWRWGTDNETRKILDSLVRLGHLEVFQFPIRDYRGRPFPESHPYHDKVQNHYSLATKWADIMCGKTSVHE